MTASGFRIARVPPLLGRHIVEADEVEGAEPVVVIGHGVWQDRFGGRPDAVGMTLRLGAAPHTVVGVMPPGFAFPINNRIWTPLRLDPLDFERGAAPPIDVFGRLRADATMEEARGQLEALGLRAAAVHPDTHARLVPRIFPYSQELVWGPTSWILHIAKVLVSGVLVVIAVNVGALVYARTGTRSGRDRDADGARDFAASVTSKSTYSRRGSRPPRPAPRFRLPPDDASNRSPLAAGGALLHLAQTRKNLFPGPPAFGRRTPMSSEHRRVDRHTVTTKLGIRVLEPNA